jgi:hypothetical protein
MLFTIKCLILNILKKFKVEGILIKNDLFIKENICMNSFERI